MSYKCENCLDTGSIKGELYLDCASCDVAKERADLHVYLAKNQFMHPYELAWLVHQRALAMAPKQEEITAVQAVLLSDMVEGNHPQYGNGLFATENCATTLYRAPAAANGALPELPEPHWKANGSYSMEQMMTYARAALSGAKGN